MNIRCLNIMSPADPNGYPQGHVNRVYDYIIVPACRLAGYWPSRAGWGSHDDPLDIVKEMIDSEIAICDISANNTNALYGLTIRQGFGLPVIVVKDMKSFITFDTSDVVVVEYDDSLRIDTVQREVEVLSEALKKGLDTKKGKHELLNRLNIVLAQTQPRIETSEEDAAPAAAEVKEPRLPIISPLPDYVGEAFTDEQIGKLKAGDVFFHLNHGKGKLNFVKKDRLASVQFDSGAKFLVLSASDFFRKIK